MFVEKNERVTDMKPKEIMIEKQLKSDLTTLGTTLITWSFLCLPALLMYATVNRLA